MKYGIKTNRFRFNGCHFYMKKRNEKISLLARNSMKTVFMFCLFAAVVILFGSESASAQSGNLAGYVVQPGRIDVIAKIRTSNNEELRIHNFDKENPITLELQVIELTQKENGEWLPFDTDPCSPFDYYEGLNISDVSSCSSWVKLDNLSITVQPDDDAVIPFKIDVPYNAKDGFYGATIMVSTRAKESETTKTPLVIRTGIPVVTSVRNTSRAPVPKVEITDIGMEFVPSLEAKPGNVLLAMKVKNNGGSFSRLNPIIRVRGFIKGHWKLITTHEFDDIGIIPGVGLTLKADLGRSLPSGKYQLDSLLYVDNELRGRGCRLAKEINFEGDPLLDEAISDVPLDITPREIIIETAPGLTSRSDHIKIHGAVDERIEIQPILKVPESLKGIADENGKLEDSLTCLDWLSFRPEKLTLGSFQTRNLSITVDMPEDALKYPNYYAALGLKVVYPDGQVAGTTWLNVCVKNKNAIPNADVKCTALSLVEISATNSEYTLQAKFENNGTTHILPTKVRAAVVKAEGLGYTSAMLYSDKAGMFMPKEKRYYTAIMDFSSLEPDDYYIEVLMEYPTKQEVKRQKRITIKDHRGTRVPELLDNEDVTELIPVQWL